MGHSPSLSDWPAQLRAQGRSMTWLASELDVSRTYLADVAAGRKHASADLEGRIAEVLAPDRLARARSVARWREVEQRAEELAEAIRRALGES